MRVMTYNLHGWKGVDGRIDIARLVRIVEASQADLVALNEVFHPFVSPGDTRPALDRLAEALGMTAAFAAALTPSDAFAPLSPYGNALLTRFPLLAHAGHHLTPIEGHEQRGLLEARILLGDGRTPLSVYVTHLDHLSETVRSEQVTALLQWTGRDRARPHLLMGDFNALAPGDFDERPAALAALQAVEASASGVRWTDRILPDDFLVVPRLQRRGYWDAAGATGGSLPTFPSDEPLVRIDYIWVSASLAPAVRWCRPWQTEETALASDHLPVVAEIDD
jgi:endonuclease/exonuclease/phosphatase family metal-dependent hydrolase